MLSRMNDRSLFDYFVYSYIDDIAYSSSFIFRAVAFTLSKQHHRNNTFGIDLEGAVYPFAFPFAYASTHLYKMTNNQTNSKHDVDAALLIASSA